MAIDTFLQPTPSRFLISSIIILASIKLAKYLLNSPTFRLSRLLKGPPNTSFLLGRTSELINSTDRGSIYERWTKDYGLVFKTPSALGGFRVLFCDPKAAAHIYTKDTFTYAGVPAIKNFSKMFGPHMLIIEGEDHRRQRRVMSPAFSNAALNRLTGVFYDSAYKVKAHWDGLFESSSEVTLDVQKWMNRITLDSIGIAGFGHDFQSIKGHQYPVTEAFGAFSDMNQGFASLLLFLLSSFIPGIATLPVKRVRLFAKLIAATSEIAEQLIENSRRAKDGSMSDIMDRSILGLLVKEGATEAGSKLSQEEIMAQVVRPFASAPKDLNQHHIYIYIYSQLPKDTRQQPVSPHPPSFFPPRSAHKTPARIATLTWALIELARNPEIQHKLREELREFSAGDLTWDQLRSELPYLDAVVHETLRTHPVLEEIGRVAAEDDTVPLSSPLQTQTTTDTVFIPKGTIIGIPIMYFNRSETLWGPDAKKFIPERWLGELTYPAKELHGYRHLFTFADGPRMCLGRGFALAEIKAVLSVLVRNFTFELTEGPETELGRHQSILPRPKLVGEVAATLPMRIRQVV
ncbi:hypothetical protein AX15_007025 [Amanita polypyramis BW_CC]|nr:hypothetical protein AX15_007025 [Amanita polypyramis BW_CC]